MYHSAVVTTWRRARTTALAAQGIDVTVVTAARWNEGGQVVELDPGSDPDVVAAPTLGRHPFLFAYDPRPIRRVVNRRHFDVIDVHEEPASVALAEVLALVDTARLDTPVVCYSAQNLLKAYPLPFRTIERRNLRRVAAVHSCNEEVERVLRAKGFDGEVVNLGLGVDIEGFSPGTGDLGETPHERFRVGYVGRITARKGLFTLLAAIGRLDDVELTVVGAGPDAAALGKAIAARNLRERVNVQGYVDHDALPGLYRSFDVLVVPSISTSSWTEQFGRVAIEAMASGVPVVVSDAGSLPEVVGDAGVVVPEADAGALAEAIRGLRDDPTLRAASARRGLLRARDFSWDRIAADQAALYRRVAAGGVSTRDSVTEPTPSG